MTSAAVRPLNGAPVLQVEDRPVFPMIMMTTPAGLRGLREMGFRGNHLYTMHTIDWWQGIDRYDFTAADRELSAMLEVDPQAWIIPRLVIDAPDEWLDAHPEELLQYGDPAAWTEEGECWGVGRHATWVSEVWRRDAAAALRALIRHAQAAPWGKAIIGWHFGAGVYGEWHYHGGPFNPDMSPLFLAAYVDWLRQRNPDFRGDPLMPQREERKRGDWAGVLDPSRRQAQIDYATFFHQVGVDLLQYFARVIKEETGGQSLTVAFNGYMPELGVNHETDHRAFDHAVLLPEVDVYANPHTYRRRAPGEDAMLRGFLGSVRLHGRLWLDEEDDRTYLAPEGQKAYTHVRTLDESVEILWRGFAQSLTHNCGLWFMDQGSMWYGDAHPYYHHPAFAEAFNRMSAIGEASLQRPRTRYSEVAVVCDLRSAFHLTDPGADADHVSLRLYADAMRELTRCGVPYDLYMLPDLFDPQMPDYRSYVFLDAVYLTGAEVERIRALRAAGRQLGFFYAPGIASDAGLSLDRMRGLLGMDLQFADEPGPHPSLPPALLSPPSPGGVVEAGLTWYCPQPPLAAGQLRRLFRQAGAQVFLESDDTLLAGGGYVGLHAATAGTKTLRLPWPATWTDVRAETVVAVGTDRLEVTVRFGETRLFAIDPARSPGDR